MPNSPHGKTWMICADRSYQDDIIRRSTRFKPPLLHSNEFDMNYNHLSVDSTHTGHSILNFPPQFTSNQVDSTTNLFDKVVLTEVVLRPTKKPRSVGPHKSILKKNGNKKISQLENKKFRSVSRSLYGIHVDLDSDEDNVPQQRLLYTNEDKKNYPLMDTGTSIPIIAWKLKKN